MPAPSETTPAEAQDRHLENLTQQLREIPALADEAFASWGTSPITGDRGTRRNYGVRTAGEMPDYVLADLDRMLTLSGANDHDGLGVLSTWTRAIRDEMAEAGWPAHGERPSWYIVDSQGLAHHAGEIDTTCDWVIRALDWCRGRGWEAELRDDIRRLHAALRAICRVRPEYTPRCRSCANVVILVDGTGRRTTPEGYSYGFCTGCAKTYPKGPAMDALGQLQEFTLAEIADRVHVPVKTLHRWHKHKLLQPTSAGRGRDRLFRLDDVMRLVEKRRHADKRATCATAGTSVRIATEPVSADAGSCASTARSRATGQEPSTPEESR